VPASRTDIDRVIRPAEGRAATGTKETTMSQTGLPVFDSTLHATNTWLNDVASELRWADKHQAYRALRAVLHALRDRLSVEQAAALAAQLPLLVRGIYYEGWHPAGKPLKERTKAEFLAPIHDGLRNLAVDAESVARAVFRVLARHVSRGEVDKVKATLPADIRSLWAEQPLAAWA
jgi:uncharacterized protein (DUF2267 family)